MAVREEIVIATKVFYPMSQRPNMGGLSRKHVVQGCEASLRRLGIETIDLYQIHRFDAAVPMEETLAALDTTSSGLSSTGSSDAGRAARVLYSSSAGSYSRGADRPLGS
jgi:aryl-alcohol dehydrogenase-like predicted oxidoreductase